MLFMSTKSIIKTNIIPINNPAVAYSAKRQLTIYAVKEEVFLKISTKNY